MILVHIAFHFISRKNTSPRRIAILTLNKPAIRRLNLLFKRWKCLLHSAGRIAGGALWVLLGGRKVLGLPKLLGEVFGLVELPGPVEILHSKRKATRSSQSLRHWTLKNMWLLPARVQQLMGWCHLAGVHHAFVDETLEIDHLVIYWQVFYHFF